MAVLCLPFAAPTPTHPARTPPRTNPPAARADWVGLSRQMPAHHPRFVMLLASCCSPVVGYASLRSAVRYARCACSFFASIHRCAYISRYPSFRPLSATPALSLGLRTPYVCPLPDPQSPRAFRGGVIFIKSSHAGYRPLHSYARAARSLRAECHVDITKYQ